MEYSEFAQVQEVNKTDNCEVCKKKANFQLVLLPDIHVCGENCIQELWAGKLGKELSRTLISNICDGDIKVNIYRRMHTVNDIILCYYKNKRKQDLQG